MSKRSAQGPQGDKDSNLFDFNMQSTPDDKPQRANAAQLAARKIKQPRGRRPNTSTPSASFSGAPFNSLDPNTVSSTQGAPQPATNGFTFGQSQSFPGAGSNPSQPTQNGSSPFAFGSGGGGGSSSFNFSSTFGGPSGTTSNPFATSAPSDGPSFSGFKGGSINITPATGASQPSFPSGGIFGAGQQPSNPPGGLFGNSSSASSQPGTTTATTSSIFGSASPSTAPSTNMFGQTMENKPSPFGQSTAFGDSMQTSPDAKNNAAQSKAGIFGTGGASSGFGTTTSFSNPGSGSLFGSSVSKPAETPAKPLFGTKPAEQSTPSSTSIFGSTTQPTAPATATSSTPATAPAPTISLFGAASSAKADTPSQNPFTTTNLFGASATPVMPKPAGGANEGEKPEVTQSKPSFSFTPSSNGASLFSQGETAVAPTPSAGGLFSPSTGSLFGPKPATPTAQDESKSSGAQPSTSLFSTSASPGPLSSAQKPLPSPAQFGSSLFATKPAEGIAGKPEKSTTATSLFSAPSITGDENPKDQPKPSSLFGQPAPAISASAVDKVQKPAPATAVPAPSPFKTNGFTPTTSVASEKEAVQTMASGLALSSVPSDLSKETKEDAEFLQRISLLNESFKREIAQLDPTKDSFDAVVLFYMRVRETIGAPVGDLKDAYRKRKSRDESDDQPNKKVKPFGVNTESTPSAKAGLSKPIGASQSTPSSTKRSLTEKDDTSGPPSEKRVNGDSSTANIFAQSFSKSKSDTSDEPASKSPIKPSTPETSKPALFSTTPTTSPAKPLFSVSASTQQDSSSSSCFSQSGPVFKPVPAAPVTKTTSTNPFASIPVGGSGSTSSTAGAPAIPKFGNGTTNFMAQFKTQADKDADKEKAKRKAEDFDSDEEDEAEWERRDAEEQEKKRKESESRQVKRSKFVPGKGFVFVDESSDAPEDVAEKATGALSNTGASVFDNKSAPNAKPDNIFQHLSATPSEAEEDNDADDTEDASTADDDDIKKDPSYVFPSEEEGTRDTDTSEAESKVVELSANESGDDGDLTKAIGKSKKTAEAGSEGRSLFDRVQYDQDGKPKRQAEGEQKTSFSGLFGSPSASSPTFNPFAPVGKPLAEQNDSKTTSANVFGTAKPAGNPFGSPAPNNSGASTPSIFGASQSTPKSGADHTWKPNSPIKFATDSNTASPAKPESQSSTPAADSSKSFSLFGGVASGTNESTGSGQQTTGFSFGGPSQQSPSVLALSSFSSATPSRASTPGVTSDTGAEESGDGEGVEKLPQVDLARGGAGEEDEDVVFETRARGLKLSDGKWESQGIGFLRILKNRTTSKGRVLLRADPSGNIVLNVALQKAISYKANSTAVQFLVPKADGPPETWALRTKKDEVERLAAAMEETKQ